MTTRMTTKELFQILKPLRPCLSGVRHLLSFKTVQEWWDDEDTSLNDRAYVWMLVAVADTDDVFAREFSEFFEEYSQSILSQVLEARAHQSFFRLESVGYQDRGKTFKFYETFRCPTAKELRASREWAKSTRRYSSV